MLYFYPKDDTPGCTTQACGFRDSKSQYEGLNAQVLGVSMDDQSSHQKFSDKYDLNFTLGSDTAGETSRSYGTLTSKSMFGNTSEGIERTTFLIDGSGIVRGIWHKVSVNGHADEIRKALQQLNDGSSETQQAA